MTSTIELGKGEFYTIEAYTFTLEDDALYEDERDEDLDTYWYDDPIFEGQSLDEYVRSLCIDCLKTSPRIVDVVAIYISIWKKYIKELSGNNDSLKRVGGTISTSIFVMMQGVQLIRVHDVNEINQSIKVFKELIK